MLPEVVKRNGAHELFMIRTSSTSSSSSSSVHGITRNVLGKHKWRAS